LGRQGRRDNGGEGQEEGRYWENRLGRVEWFDDDSEVGGAGLTL